MTRVNATGTQGSTSGKQRQPISYSEFRTLLRDTPAHRIVNTSGGETHIYSGRRQLLAIITPPSFNARGNLQPVNYYRVAPGNRTWTAPIRALVMLPLVLIDRLAQVAAKQTRQINSTGNSTTHRPSPLQPRYPAGDRRWTTVRLVG